jgi:hypothetical protein
MSGTNVSDVDQCIAELLVATSELDTVSRYQAWRRLDPDSAPHGTFLTALRELLNRPSPITGRAAYLAAVDLDEGVRHAAARAYALGAEEAAELGPWLRAVGIMLSAAARAERQAHLAAANALNPVVAIDVELPGEAA